MWRGEDEGIIVTIADRAYLFHFGFMVFMHKLIHFINFTSFVWDNSKDQNCMIQIVLQVREVRASPNSAARQELKESAGTGSRLEWDDKDRQIWSDVREGGNNHFSLSSGVTKLIVYCRKSRTVTNRIRKVLECANPRDKGGRTKARIRLEIGIEILTNQSKVH